MADETTRKSDEAAKVNLAAEETYWREHHAAQSHASEETTFEHFAPAYRVGAEAATKYPGKTFDEIEDNVALDYEKHQVGSALPWDRVRSASRAAWTRLSGVNSPRDPSRGMRGGI